MDKYIFDSSNGLWYERNGDYYIPCLTLPDAARTPISLWGQRHLRHLKSHHLIPYTNLLLSGKLNAYLADIDEQATNMFFLLVKQMAEYEGVTEKLKAENQLDWVARMNSICDRTTEVVNADLIYT